MGVVLLSCQVLQAMARQPALDSRSPVLCLAPAPGSVHPWYCGFPALVDMVFGGILKTLLSLKELAKKHRHGLVPQTQSLTYLSYSFMEKTRNKASKRLFCLTLKYLQESVMGRIVSPHQIHLCKS